jgi:hypothetical protein
VRFLRLGELTAGRALAAAAAAIQLALVARIFAVPGEIAGDDMSIHLAEIVAMSRSLAAGDLDLWNPSANAGFASAYYYQFLPQLGCALLHLVFGSVVGLVTLFKLTVAVGLAAVPLTVYRGLRVVGLAPLAAGGGALAASLVFADSGWGAGIDSVFLTGLYTQTFALAAFPLAAAYAGRYLAGGEHLARAVGYSVLCGACHPMVAVAVAPALLAAPWWRLDARTLATRAAVLLGATLAFAAPLWLPIVVHFDAFGGFPARVAGEEGIWPLDFARAFASGELIDHGRLPVLSALAALAVPVAALMGGARALAPVAGAGAVYAVLISLGPVVGKAPGDLIPAIRFLGPMQLCLGAAGGAAAVLAARWLWPRMVAAAARRAAPPWVPAIALAAASLLLAAVVIDGARRRAAVRVHTVASYPSQHRAELGFILRFLGARPQGRVFADGELGTGAHWWMYLPYVYAAQPAARAYGGAALQSSPNYRYLRRLDLARHWRLFAIRYLLVRDGYPIPEGLPLQAILTTAHYRVLALPAVPLMAAVTPIGSLPADRDERVGAVLAWLGEIELAADRVLVAGPPLEPVAAPGEVEVEILERERARHRAAISVPGSRPALIRLAVSHHPGWRARVDGEPAEIRRISPAMMAVMVPPGDHQLELSFARPAWTWVLYLAGIAAAIAWWLIGRRRRRLGASAAAAAVLALLGVPGQTVAAPGHAPADAAIDLASGAAAVATASGIWFRDRRDQPFRWLCPAVSGGEAGAFEPRVAVGLGATVHVAGYRGLRSGDGCHLEPASFSPGPGQRPEVSLWVSSIAVGADGVTWATTADGRRPNDVYRSVPGADVFDSVGLRSATLWYLSAVPAPSHPGTVYISAYQVAPPAAALFRFEAGRARRLPLDGLRLGRSRRSHVAAIDPGDRDSVFLRVEAAAEPAADHLYRSSDGGRHWRLSLEAAGPIAGVVSRGGEVWVAVGAPCKSASAGAGAGAGASAGAGAGAGAAEPGCLYRSTDRGSSFAEAIPGPALRCLIDGGDHLLGCRADAESSGVALVAIDEKGASRPALRLEHLAPPCAAALERCPEWARLCSRLGADCAAPPGPSPAPTPRPPQARAPRPTGWWWIAITVAALAPLVWLARRRRRARG